MLQEKVAAMGQTILDAIRIEDWSSVNEIFDTCRSFSANICKDGSHDDTGDDQNYDKDANSNLLSLIASLPLDPQGRLLVHYASLYRAPFPVMQQVIQANPYGPATRANTGCLPIYPALRAGSEASDDLVKLLLNSPGVKPTLKYINNNGMCALHMGCLHGVPHDVLAQVIAKSPDCVLIPSVGNNYSPLAAYWYRLTKVKAGKKAMEVLWQHYISKKKKPVDQVSHEYLMESWRIMILFLQGVYVKQHYSLASISDEYDRIRREQVDVYPLHLIAQLGCPTDLMMLGIYALSVENGDSDIRKLDNDGRSAINVALHSKAQNTLFIMPNAGPCDEEDGFDSEDESLDDESSVRSDSSSFLAERIMLRRYEKESLNSIFESKGIHGLSLVEIILLCHPKIAEVRGPSLPLQTALSIGLSWKDGLRAIYEANPDAITSPNKSRLYPFMQAAKEERCSLETTYRLLTSNPDVMNSLKSSIDRRLIPNMPDHVKNDIDSDRPAEKRARLS